MVTKRLAEWLGTVEGLAKSLLAAAIAFAALASAVKGWLASLADALAAPNWAAGALTAVPVLLLLLWAALSYRRFTTQSRLEEQPDRFTLVATTPGSLIGRTNDLDRLLHAVERNRIVLLDGESGCGKSALIAAGLVPRLRDKRGLLPVLVRNWSDDWVRGPLAATLDALCSALTEEQRAQLEWTEEPDLAADAESLAEEVQRRLDATRNVLGRRPLLIADQFDDYQAQHRHHFLDDQGNWLKPDALAAANPFWRLVRKRLLDGSLHLLAVTRADTASGLSCIRFREDSTVDRSLPRVEVDYLHSLLAGIAPDGAQPPVVSNPAQGWHELRERLEADLRAQGAILMQQVRMLLLGLCQLRVLTPTAYRRAGELHGLETLVITRALEHAAGQVGGGEAGLGTARRILNALVLPGGPDQAPKAQRCAWPELVRLAGGERPATLILGTLQQSHIVRPAEGLGREAVWQLDHDYLARAVVVEKRAADRWSVLLREGDDAWHRAAGSWREQWRALLPVSTQAALLWARLRGQFRYGPHRIYALSSAAPTIAILVLLPAAVWFTVDEYRLWMEARHIMEGLSTRSKNGARAAWALWTAKPRVRERAVAMLLDSPRLPDSGTTWVFAFVSLEPAPAKWLTERLRIRIERGGDDSNRRRALAEALGAVATRLPTEATAEAAAAAAVLRGSLGEGDSDARQASAEALGMVATRLAPEAAAAEVMKLRYDLERARVDPRAGRETQLALVLALWEVTTRREVTTRLAPEATEAAAAAAALRNYLERGEADPNTRAELIRALGAVVTRLAPAAAAAEAAPAAAALRHDLARGGGNLYTQAALIGAFTEVAALLGPEVAADEAEKLRSHFGQTEVNPRTRQALIWAFTAVAARLGPEAAAFQAEKLRDHLGRPEADPDTPRALIRAFTAVAARLAPEAAADEAEKLRKGLEEEELNLPKRNAFAVALEAVAARLGPEAAAFQAEKLRDHLGRPEADPDTPRALIRAFTAVAARLAPEAAADEAEKLRKGLEEEELNLPKRNAFAVALEAVAARLGPEAAAFQAEKLRDHLGRLGRPEADPETRRALIRAFTAAVARLGPEAAADEVEKLRKGLEEEELNWPKRNAFAVALEAVAARLGPEAAAFQAEKLRESFGRPEADPETRRALIRAFTAVAARLEPEAAADEVEKLRVNLGRPEADPDTRRALIRAFTAVAARLAPEAAEEAGLAAAALRRRLLSEPQEETRTALFRALGVVAARLTTEAAALTAAALRRHLEHGESDPNTRTALVEALGAVAPQLRPEGAANEAKELRGHLERGEVDPDIRTTLIRALGVVTARLTPEVADEAKRAAAVLRSRLQLREPHDETRTALIWALGEMAARLAAQPKLKRHAIEDLMLITALPINDHYVSKNALGALEIIANREFKGDLPAAVVWAREAMGLDPVIIRPASQR